MAGRKKGSSEMVKRWSELPRGKKHRYIASAKNRMPDATDEEIRKAARRAYYAAARDVNLRRAGHNA
jgi:hypothetical protein